MERQTLIITQGLCLSTVQNVILRGQPLTLQNIIQKANIKVILKFYYSLNFYLAWRP